MRMAAVWYPVRDWDEARHFYGEVLGLTEGAGQRRGGLGGLQHGRTAAVHRTAAGAGGPAGRAGGDV